MMKRKPAAKSKGTRRRKAAVPATTTPAGWDFNFGAPFWTSGANWGWGGVIQEPFTGAWQRNLEQRPDSLLSFFAVYSCVTLIASDIAKIRLRLMEEDGTTDVWEEVDVPSFSPVLKKPNHFQNRIKFIEQWIVSKLTRGNAYILKQRDDRNVVVRLYVLDPNRCKPLVAPDGSVYYDLGGDVLAGVPTVVDPGGVVNGRVVVPASEIIHDVMVPLYHPLCGVSPIYACALAAIQGLNIQNNSSKFFQNGSNPGGVLTAPGTINDITAKRLKDYWEQNYTGANVGKVAVLGDGLKYEKMSMTAEDAQLIDQLKWTGENVCAVFHVPPHMVGIGATPAYNNIEALGQQYYSQCLQSLMECVELCMDEGLGLPDVKGHVYGTEFDLDDLLRMDTLTKVEAAGKSINAGFLSPNEARAKFNLPPAEGGDTPYLQQQNYSLAALAKRDSAAPAPASTTSTPSAPSPSAPTPAAPTAPSPKEVANVRSIVVDLRRRARAYARATA